MTAVATGSGTSSREDTNLRILFAIGFCHLTNDMLQSLFGAIYPNLRTEFHLTLAQIGLVTLSYQLTASLLQPLVGLYADERPTPYSLPGGTLFTFAGLLLLSTAKSYPALLVGGCVLGVGSSIFHPESSRVARMASGGRHGFAQSLFQLGGSIGGALGPAGAALVVSYWGRGSLGAFSILALVSTVVLGRVGLWYKRHGLGRLARGAAQAATQVSTVSAGRVRISIAILLVLIFSKYVYLASITSYYTFYLIDRFGLSVRGAQIHLFAFLAAVALGTFVGGPMGDRFGRKRVIWFSILGVLPFTVVLPYASLFWTTILTIVIGLILASAFSAIVVYGQELITGRVGMVSGLFYGFSFGAAGAGAALLGKLADATSIEHVFRLCSFLPALGMLTTFLPSLSEKRRTNAEGR